MDIHRCRFVPYPLSTINALAFSHDSTASAGDGKTPSSLRLAVGRANGDIELWNPQNGNWVQEVVMHGGKDRSIEGLVWTQENPEEDKVDGGRLRLFSIGYSSYVTEWDLAAGKPLRHSSSDFGEIWCMAVQPGGERGASQDIVVGCADGAIVLLSTSDADLRFKRALSRSSKKKARVLSLCYQSAHIVVAGCADGTLRVIDTRNGQLLRMMSAGINTEEGPREILVWAVKALPDGTIVSGDSTGEVRFWDARTFTLVQRIKSHRADVLDIEPSADGRQLMSGGMDRRTVTYRLGTGDNARWSAVHHQRIHSHDVKVLAKYEGGGISVMASGGLDAMLAITPMERYQLENHRTISTLPQHPPLQSAGRWLMSYWDREVRVWLVTGQPQLLEPEQMPPGQKPFSVQTRVCIKGEENISSAALSSDGKLLIISTMSQIKWFSLRRRSNLDEKSRIRARLIPTPECLEGMGASQVTMSPDGKWLCLVNDTESVSVCRVTQTVEAERPRTILYGSPRMITLRRPRRDEDERPESPLGGYDRSITRLAFSGDCRLLSVSDLSGYVDSWVLEGYEDMEAESTAYTNGDGGSKHSDSDSDGDDDEDDSSSDHSSVYGQRWVLLSDTLPKLPSAPLVLSYRPTPPTKHEQDQTVTLHPTRHDPHPRAHERPVVDDRLLIVTATHGIYEFHVLEGKLTPWSRANATNKAPDEFRIQRDRAIGVVWDCTKGKRERVWVYGRSWLCMFDMSRVFETSNAQYEQDSEEEVEEVGVEEITRSNRRRLMRKRKRETETREILHLPDSGAGSQIPDEHVTRGMGRKIRKTETRNGTTTTEEIPLTRPLKHESDDEDEEVDGEGEGESYVNGSTESTGPAFWITYKYRPILGLASLGPPTPDEEPVEEGLGLPEIALVERPSWDADLPARVVGDQEWDY